MTKGDAEEAHMMTGLLTGMVMAALYQATTALVQPVTIERVDAQDGVIQVRLASGMLATCTIRVEPVVRVTGV